MTIERIVELEQFIEREMKGNEALTNDAGCVARAKIDRDILACLKELKAHREAWMKVVSEVDQHTDIHSDGELYIKNFDVKKIIAEYRPKEGDAECPEKKPSRN